MHKQLDSLAALRFRLNGADTLRYHGFRMLMEDTVGHHSHNVISILLAIYPDASRELIIAAHDHDVAEHITGDMPSPTKRNIPGLRDAFGEYEAQIMSRVGLGVEESDLDDFDKLWLKLADSLDGMRFCLNEKQLGNTKIAHVFHAFASYVEEILPVGNETYAATWMVFNHFNNAWKQELVQ